VRERRGGLGLREISGSGRVRCRSKGEGGG
jgi:hypothetical protein